MKAVSVTYSVASSASPAKGEVDLLISEWDYDTSLASRFWNGHYYSAESGNYTWAEADAGVRHQRGLLGGMNGSLAVVDLSLIHISGWRRHL